MSVTLTSAPIASSVSAERKVTATCATLAAPQRRWLHVVSHTDPRYGGLSAAVPALAASVEATSQATATPLRMQLAAFCLHSEQYRPAPLEAGEVSFWPTSRMAWLRDKGLRARFRKQVEHVDGLHIHGLWEQSTAAACRAARRCNKPYVLSAHGMLEPWALAAKRRKKQIYATLIERRNVEGAACLQALTEAEARQYRAFGARGPIAVIPNAVALPAIADAEIFLDRFPVLRGKRLVLFLSRLHPKKGLNLLMESWAKVGPTHPEAHLVVAGPDSEGMQSRLTEALRRDGMERSVTFPGMLAGAMKWSALRAATCYVLPSYSEGLSMALLEAMGVGVPVIATRACNMPEITEAAAGLEIEANSEALSQALDGVLLQDEAACERMGRNGARLIAERYSPAVVAGQTAALYDWLLGGARPAGVRLVEEGAL